MTQAGAMARLVKEEVTLREGKATIICVDSGRKASFRLLYRKNLWREDEWVRIDSEGEDTFLQVRKRLGKLRCEDLRPVLELILDKLEGLGGLDNEDEELEEG